MTGPLSFRDRPRPRGSGRRVRPEVATGIAIVLFLSLALLKPWGDGAQAGVDAGPSASGRSVAPGTTPGPTTSTTRVTPAPSAVALTPLDLGLSIPDVSARSIESWGSLDWQRLPAGGASPFVTSVLEWKSGFVALGRMPDATESIVWTSVDGSHWVLLPFATATTFWPGSTIVGLAELGDGLVAVATLDTGCIDVDSCAEGGPSIVSWTSTDGIAWTPDALPDPGPAEALRGVVVATSPEGLVAVSAGDHVTSATTLDGVTWTVADAVGMGPSTTLSDAAHASVGFLVAGSDGVGPDTRPTVWRSRDSVSWTPSTLAGLPGTDGGRAGSIATSLAVGRDGAIAHVRGVTNVADTWWQTSDGLVWQPLPTAPRKGPWLFAIDGHVVGDLLAGDGSRIVAFRGGGFPVAWISSDGRSWRQIAVRGDLPSEAAQRAILVPGGMLVTDGRTAWLGTAGAG